MSASIRKWTVELPYWSFGLCLLTCFDFASSALNAKMNNLVLVYLGMFCFISGIMMGKVHFDIIKCVIRYKIRKSEEAIRKLKEMNSRDKVKLLPKR